MAIDPAERLLNLIIALTHARVRMTRAQIRSAVEGYEPADPSLDPAEAARKEAAFERMFERDKEDLRRMGIPLRTVVDPTHGDEIGYRIDASDAALPAIDLSPAEVTVLALAAEFWHNAALGTAAKQALTKVASGVAPQPHVSLPFAARSTVATENMALLAEALSNRQSVTFEYTSDSSGTSLRTVEPWQILMRGGAEYVVGLDRDRGEKRTFRIGRIHGAVKLVGPEGAYELPSPLPRAFEADRREPRTAMVALRPESGHRLRERGRVVGVDGDWDLVEVEYRYDDALRDDVLGLAGAARIIHPSHIAEQVREYASLAIEVARG